MMEILKVLHVMNELKPSGAESMLRLAGPRFAAAGCESHILSTGKIEGAYATALRNAGYDVHHRPHSRAPTFYLALSKWWREEGFDVIHIQSERGFFAYVLAARWAGIRRILRTVHNNFNFDGFLRLRRGVERRLSERLGVRIVSIGPGVHRNESERYGVHPKMIVNWYDSERFSPLEVLSRIALRAKLQLPAETFILLSVGNCSKVKNHTALLNALAGLKDLRWLYLHAGIEEADHPEQALATQLGIADRVSFLGATADVLPLLQASDLFVMPSLVEGMSIAALEALGVGIEILLAESPGLVDLREYVSDVHFCPPTAEAIGSALRDLILHGPKFDAGVAGQRNVAARRLFGLDRGVSAYAALYRGLDLSDADENQRAIA